MPPFSFPDREQVQLEPEERELRSLRRLESHRGPADLRLNRGGNLHPHQPGQIDQPVVQLRERPDGPVTQAPASDLLHRSPVLSLFRHLAVPRASVLQHRRVVILRR